MAVLLDFVLVELDLGSTFCERALCIQESAELPLIEEKLLRLASPLWRY
jgi:hypothetical protein